MSKQRSLTEGSVITGFLYFLLPLMAGQLLQQLYNVADAWVIGNFADNTSFAAVSSVGNLSFLVVGFFSGLSTGAGVVIARYFGADDRENTIRAIHSTVLFGLLSSLVVTVIMYSLTPYILTVMKTPENVLPLAVAYFRIYCAGVSTIILYNVFMAVMRALGNSLSPLMYLAISSVINVILDLVLVAGFHLGVYGAAFATVLAQGISAVLCFLQMQRDRNYMHISLQRLRFYPEILRNIVFQGLPAGIQNSALSLGNVSVQSSVNRFGEFAMAGLGAHSKIEGFVFIPVLTISMALATFVSQNIGAGQWKRVRQGVLFGILTSVTVAQLIGAVLYAFAPQFLGAFCSDSESVRYGIMFTRMLTLFYIPLAFTHAATGTLQGLGKSFLPMATLIAFWCLFRVIYVNTVLRAVSDFTVICRVYPISWCLSAGTLLILLLLQIRKLRRQ